MVTYSCISLKVMIDLLIFLFKKKNDFFFPAFFPSSLLFHHEAFLKNDYDVCCNLKQYSNTNPFMPLSQLQTVIKASALIESNSGKEQTNGFLIP